MRSRHINLFIIKRSARTVKHILRVEQTAADLAQYHNLDRSQAATAGLMYDPAKCFKP
ncbi:MAG: hypothetical protein AAF630_04410 [Cyanobacteria bacterium P01_C01_bin.38]